MSDDRMVEIGDLLEFRFPSRPTLSADGTRLLYVVQQAEPEKNRYTSEIWLAQLDPSVGAEPFRLTHGEGDSDPLWLDDGRVLFRSARDQDRSTEKGRRSSAYYTISPDGGEAAPWFTVERPVTWMRQLSPTRFLVLTQWDPTAGEEQGEHETRVHVFEKTPIWANGSGFLHDGAARLGIFDTEAGQLVDLTPDSLRVSTAALSPGRDRAVVIASRNDALYRPENRLYLCELGDMTIGDASEADARLMDLSERTALPVGYHSMPVFADDETLLFGFADPAEHGLNTSPQVYRTSIAVEAGAAVATRLTDEQTLRLGVNSVGTDVRMGTPGNAPPRFENGWLYLVGTRHGDSLLVRVGLDGTIEELTGEPGSVDAFDVAGGTICMVAMREWRLPELYLLREDGERRITALNDEYFHERRVAVAKHMSVSSNGDDLDAWVLLPPWLDVHSPPARSIPAVLDIHGGPRTVYGNVFSHEMQVWAAAGFAVIYGNPHGSDGRGDSFADIWGRYGSLDYEDIMTIVDRALEHYPLIDPDRLVVTGGSYGGFMTNWIIGRTDRFAAAASQRSISNWVAFWGTSDIGTYFGNDQTGTDPWTDASELWRQSPLAYADRVSTPTLLLHSDADHRCPIADAVQMHAALCYHGVESRLVWIENENHELSRGGKPGPRIRRLEEITGWFRSHLDEP